MKSNKLLFFLLVLFLLPFSGQAQKSKSQLEKEKKENIRRIKEANSILKQTKEEKQATLAQLSAIEQEIEAREDYISSLTEEVSLLDEDTRELQSVIVSLEEDHEDLKEEYARMVRASYDNQRFMDKLTFLFSAENFNQMVMRLRYFRRYSEARTYQVEQIRKVKATLQTQKLSLSMKKKEKVNVLEDQKKEYKDLEKLKKDQASLIAKLTDKEKDLRKEVTQREKANKKLDKLIADIVRREIERAKKEAEAKESATAGIALTPEAKALSGSFAANKTRLPWPVTRGQISQKFGRHAHRVLKGVETENLGVDIMTLKDEQVRCVFEGKVVTTAEVPGMHNIVMVQHGEYFTVYARLKEVSVSPGQQVNTKDILGLVHTGNDGVSELQFQVWKNNEKLDPETWLYKK